MRTSEENEIQRMRSLEPPGPEEKTVGGSAWELP